jgi:ribose transport system permease protein
VTTDEQTTTTAIPKSQRDRRLRAEHVRDYGIIAFVVGLFVALAAASSHFLTVSNLMNILYQNSPVGIMACAVTLVIVGGNFDLSLGAMYGLAGVCASWIAVHVAAGPALPAAVIAGGLMGLLNGLLVTRLRVNSFLATLATSLAYSGAATAWSGGFPIEVSNGTFTALGLDRVGPVWYAVIAFAVAALVLQFTLGRTVFGRYVHAVGGNPSAARLAGLNVTRTVVITFVISGLAAGLAGLIFASESGGSSPGGIDPTLTAIAAVAIGGTSIFGGIGSVWRTVVGVVLLALVTNGFDLLGVQAFYQDIVKAGFIIAAVSISSMFERG